jgi:hypothetical protein
MGPVDPLRVSDGNHGRSNLIRALALAWRCSLRRPPDEKGQIMAEEEKAWKLGRVALEDLGCDQWGEFERLQERSLKTYREGLAKVPDA